MDAMWMQVLVTAISALTGGMGGGGIVAYRLGQWRQRIESRLQSHQERLDSGADRVRSVDVLRSRMDVLIDEMRAWRTETREDRAQFVTREECSRTHQRGA